MILPTSPQVTSDIQQEGIIRSQIGEEHSSLFAKKTLEALRSIVIHVQLPRPSSDSAQSLCEQQQRS